MRQVTTRARVLAFAAAGALLLPAIAAAQTPAAGRQPTFTKDVAPILQRSCVNCHRPGEMAPMSLMTYEEARPWARAIKTRVSLREMPPWHIDKSIGITKFKNDPSLSDDEIATIVKWVDAGAPRGNPADMPPPASSPTPSVADRQAGSRDQVPGLQGSGRRARICSATSTPTSRSPRIATSRRFRREPSTPASRKVVHHALSFAVDDPSSRGSQRRRQPGRGRRPVPGRVRVGQERRGVSRGLRRAAAGRQEGDAAAITSTRSAKRRTPKSSSA